ncbi:MAG TPA: hypothetical protein VFV86_00470, partial [Nitrososphaeraceae archaeon]|nr:hypothetical protein [Nitrososphaeraceae archaeon]
MRNFYKIRIQLSIIGILAILLFNTYNNQLIYAHNFAADESASFLALIDEMQIEMNLINANLLMNNQSLAQAHLTKIKQLYTDDIKEEIAEKNERVANDISSIINETNNTIEQENNSQGINETIKNFNDIIGETISVRIDQDALNNATVQALHFANLINLIDQSYAAALGEKHLNMTAMNISTQNNNSHGHNNKNISSDLVEVDRRDNNVSSNITEMHNDTKHNSSATETGKITDIASYQTAKELTNTALDLFNSIIKQNIPTDAIENADTI